MGISRSLGSIVCAVSSTVLVVLAAVPMAASAGPGKERTETQPYAFSHGIRTGHEDQGIGTEENYAPPLVFEPRRGEKSVTFRVADAADTPVLVKIYQPGRGGSQPIEAEFCGNEDRFRLVSGEPVEVHIYSGFCLNHTWGLATAGQITATFSTARVKAPPKLHDH